MVGGQKELVPDPKQDSNLDETPFPESALSFDEEMMHSYDVFLNCSPMTQSSAIDGLSPVKNSTESSVFNEIAERKQDAEKAVLSQKPLDTSNLNETVVTEKSLASEENLQNTSKISTSDTRVHNRGRFSGPNDSCPKTEEITDSDLKNRDTPKHLWSASPISTTSNNSMDTTKSSNKAIGKTKVQKIPASKYAPPKKPRNNEPYPRKKTKEKTDDQHSEHVPSWNVEDKNLTVNIGSTNTLDMPQLLSPPDISRKSKSLSSNQRSKNEPEPLSTSPKNKNESKESEPEMKKDTRKTTKIPQDNGVQQMQYNMYDRTKAMKRNAARVQNYYKFYGDDDTSSNKSYNRKITVKDEQLSVKQEPHTYPNISKASSVKRKPSEIETLSKKLKVEDYPKEDVKQSETKKIKIEEYSKGAVKQHETYKFEIPQKTRDLDSEFDKLKSSGPYKSSSFSNSRATRTDRILRSAQEGEGSHRQVPSTSSQYRYGDRAKREDYRRYTDNYRQTENCRRQYKIPERSRSPHSQSR